MREMEAYFFGPGVGPLHCLAYFATPKYYIGGMGEFFIKILEDLCQFFVRWTITETVFCSLALSILPKVSDLRKSDEDVQKGTACAFRKNVSVSIHGYVMRWRTYRNDGAQRRQFKWTTRRGSAFVDVLQLTRRNLSLTLAAWCEDVMGSNGPLLGRLHSEKNSKRNFHLRFAASLDAVHESSRTFWTLMDAKRSSLAPSLSLPG